MKILSSTLETTGCRTGFTISLALIIYFIIMRAFGLAQILELRFLNFIILAAGICYAINKYKNKNDLSSDDFYLKGFGLGLYTSAVAAASFALFISLFLAYMEPALMRYIKSTVWMGEYLNSPAVFLIIFLEGMASGLIITFCAMQYFKSAVTRNHTQYAK